MDRLAFLRQDISRNHEVLEIAPWFNPIAPKAAGYRTTTLDIFDTATLRERAAADPNIPREMQPDIEDIDLVGSACDVADLAAAKYGESRRFDWILSSHNMEHIPDPIRFLQQSERILRDGGILRMAIPDKRFCFDHFRPLSETSELLQAFHEQRTRPSIYQVFREQCLVAHPSGDRWVPAQRTLESYDRWFGPHGSVPDEYIDTHCWAFTPDSFELIVRDLVAFGLISLQVDRISPPKGIEFHVDLRKVADPPAVSAADYFSRREELLVRCNQPPRKATTPPPASPAGPREKQTVPRRIVREIRRVVRQAKSLRRAS